MPLIWLPIIQTCFFVFSFTTKIKSIAALLTKALQEMWFTSCQLPRPTSVCPKTVKLQSSSGNTALHLALFYFHVHIVFFVFSFIIPISSSQLNVRTLSSIQLTVNSLFVNTLSSNITTFHRSIAAVRSILAYWHYWHFFFPCFLWSQGIRTCSTFLMVMKALIELSTQTHTNRGSLSVQSVK